MTDGPGAGDTLSSRDAAFVDSASAELRVLEEEVRALERQGRNVLGAGFAAATLSLALASRISLAIGFVLLTLLWGLAIAWQFNLAAEVAAVAELRDWLAEEVNRVLGRDVHRKNVVGDAGRSSIGTTLAGSVIFVVYVGAQVAAFLNLAHPFTLLSDGGASIVQSQPTWTSWALQVLATVLATAAAATSWSALYRYRSSVRFDLNYRLGEISDQAWNRLIKERTGRLAKESELGATHEKRLQAKTKQTTDALGQREAPIGGTNEVKTSRDSEGVT